MNDKSKLTKVQELVYELKVSDALTKDIITTGPDLPMSKLREILRSRRISGVPVMDHGELAGIISIEDFIRWLADGQAPCTVRERMTRSVQTLYDDEPLVHAVGMLNKMGFGRIPVLSRSSRALTGVITKGDIIAALLRKLEIDYHEEEIHRYRASHIFEDIIADEVWLQFRSRIVSGDFKTAGRVSSQVRRTLVRLGINPALVRRAAIASYEAEMNVCIYAHEGLMSVTVQPDHIAIEITDKGPGIADIEKAMQPGYSTAPDWVRELGFGAGMGLCNIKKCADTMALDSCVNIGTHVSIRINIPPAAKHAADAEKSS